MTVFRKAGKTSSRMITLLVFFSILAHPLSPCGGEKPEAIPIVPAESFPDAFLNRDFSYDISFLWFAKAAAAHFYFEKGEKPAEYRAVLDAETKGFIGWLSSYRRQRYVSVMELVKTGNKKMLRSKYFSQEIITEEKSWKTEFLLDYSKRVMETREYEKGREPTTSTGEIPENIIYNDVLSSYYNLRGGVFGVKRKGDTFKIDTMPRKGVSHITVTIADEETENKKKIGMEEAYFLVRLDVDKRLFGQKDGTVWVWADTDFVPVMGEVKNVVLFGDVRGYRKLSKPD